jgi:hypothetical protein
VKRGTSTQFAVGSAFVGAARKVARSSAPPPASVRLGLHPGGLAFVAGFPGLIGVTALGVSVTRSIPEDGARPLGIITLVVAGALLALGLGSRLVVTPEFVSVRFFGLRSTTVRFADLVSATFSMAFPSISFAITLRDRFGRRAIIHANWWHHEGQATVPILRAIAARRVPVDRSTARIVGQVLSGPRPVASIVHHGLIRKDRTW